MRLRVVVPALLVLVACGGEPTPAPVPPPTPAPAAPPAADPHANMPGMDHGAAAAEFAPAPAGAKVAFVELAEGAAVKSPLKVRFSVEGMTVKPAGELAAGTGHFHVLIDVPAGAAGEVVPKDEAHLHFGQGQTEAELTLTPGEHSLTLLFADGQHRSYGPGLSSTVKVKVQ